MDCGISLSLFLSYLPTINWHNLRMREYRFSITPINIPYLNNFFALYNIPIFLEILFSLN